MCRGISLYVPRLSLSLSFALEKLSLLLSCDDDEMGERVVDRTSLRFADALRDASAI
jgi:hypothetical protein